MSVFKCNKILLILFVLFLTPHLIFASDLQGKSSNEFTVKSLDVLNQENVRLDKELENLKKRVEIQKAKNELEKAKTNIATNVTSKKEASIEFVPSSIGPPPGNVVPRPVKTVDAGNSNNKKAQIVQNKKKSNSKNFTSAEIQKLPSVSKIHSFDGKKKATILFKNKRREEVAVKDTIRVDDQKYIISKIEVSGVEIQKSLNGEKYVLSFALPESSKKEKKDTISEAPLFVTPQFLDSTNLPSN